MSSVVTDLSLIHFGGSVEAQIAVSMEVEERFEDVQHARHLCEDKHAMGSRTQLS